MNEDQYSEEMRNLAQQFAPLMVDKTLPEIARILYLAHARWDKVRKDYLQELGKQDADVDEVFAHSAAALTSAILEELPLAMHDQVMQLFRAMRENARFDRLLQDVHLGQTDGGEA